jgi:hypothetical protein
MRVLVACEMSGRVRDAFARRGWEAWSADLLPSETPVRWTVTGGITHGDGGDYPGFHYQGDCRDLFDPMHPVNGERWLLNWAEPDKYPLWDLVIAHPPCDHLSYAGARWFKAKQVVPPGKDKSPQQEAADFFTDMINAPSPLVAVENPHCIMQRLYRYPNQIVQPWMFGDPYVKGIHLWLQGLPKLTPTHAEGDYPELFRTATGGGSWRTDKAAERKLMSAYEDGEGRVNRARVRSRTFKGLAGAMAAQWGAFAENYYRERDLR